jgi:hypothetical protein
MACAPARLFLAFFLLHGAGASLAQGLSAPTLQATAFESDYVVLQWTDWEGYSTNKVERKSGDSAWSQIAEVGQANSYIDRGTVAGVTYTYRVQALTSEALITYSNEASATTPGTALLPPSGTPTLYADAVSHTAVRLHWTDIDGETQYKIERQNQFGHWEEIHASGENSADFLETELTPNTLYIYRIRGWNAAGYSPYSNQSAATTFQDPSIIPAVPNIFSDPHTDTSIRLQWSYIKEASGYRIEAKTAPSGSWTEIMHIERNDITYAVHTNLTHSTKYTYRIRAYSIAGISDYSQEWSSTTYLPPPASPELRGIPISYNELELRWTDVLEICCTQNGYIGYRLEAWTNNAWLQIRFPSVNDTNHFVRGLQPSTEYTFRIVALHPLPSKWSTVTVRTMDPPPIAPAIAPVLYADRDSSSTINLKWLDVELETEYRIERENFPGGGVWQQIATAAANTTSYLDTSLDAGTTYVYRIRAANSYGASPYSNEAAASTRPPPEEPLLLGGADTPTSVLLFVQPAEGADLYRLERMDASGEWQVIHETDTATFRFEDTGLEPSTPYTYRAGARNAAGTWFYSASLTTQTWPLEFIATGRPLSATSIKLSWPAFPHAEHIYIQPLTNGVSWPFRPIELDGTATNHIITDLAASTTYNYRVYASSAIGGRSLEAPVTVTTLGSISGDIIIRSITPAEAGATYRLRLTGSTGQKFKVQSTADFNTWTDRTEPLTLSSEMEVSVPSIGNGAFYRTIKVE